MLASKLKVGDTIGLIAPDKALKSKDNEYVENATKYFESLGLKIKFGKDGVSDFDNLEDVKEYANKTHYNIEKNSREVIAKNV